jgi:hypothetical protein
MNERRRRRNSVVVEHKRPRIITMEEARLAGTQLEQVPQYESRELVTLSNPGPATRALVIDRTGYALNLDINTDGQGTVRVLVTRPDAPGRQRH